MSARKVKDGCKFGKSDKPYRGKGAKKKAEKQSGTIYTSTFLLFLLVLNRLTVPSEPPERHGYYYKCSGEKCKNQVYFTEGIGLHDGITGKQVEWR